MAGVTVVFCDGACSGNPGPGGWAAIVARPDGRVRELGGRSQRTTNNRMELTAAIQGLREAACGGGPIEVYTDSTYVIRGITQWLPGWKRKGWRTAAGEPVLNRELWLELEEAQRGAGAAWRYVRGHAGCPGNERCDALAVALSLGRPAALFDGRSSQYGHDLSRRPVEPLGAARPAKRGSQRDGPAVYLSLVDGRLERHASWPECQARVAGRSHALFKKVGSAEEEQAVLRRWGLGG